METVQTSDSAPVYNRNSTRSGIRNYNDRAAEYFRQVRL